MNELITIFIVCIGAYFITTLAYDANHKKTKNKSSRSSLNDAINVNAEELLKSENERKLTKQLIQKKYKSIAKFYNNYKFIDYSNPRNKKMLARQMNDIVNIVDKNLKEASELSNNTSYRLLLGGIITFKHITIEKFIEVNNDLIKLHKLGKDLEFDRTFMSALERVINEENELGV